MLARGDALLAPDVTRRVIGRFGSPVSAARSMTASSGGVVSVDLTPREREVLVALTRGWSNAEIAVALVIREATVKTHVSHLLLKLGVRDRTQLVVWAFQHGMAAPGR